MLFGVLARLQRFVKTVDEDSARAALHHLVVEEDRASVLYYLCACGDGDFDECAALLRDVLAATKHADLPSLHKHLFLPPPVSRAVSRGAYLPGRVADRLGACARAAGAALFDVSGLNNEARRLAAHFNHVEDEASAIATRGGRGGSDAPAAAPATTPERRRGFRRKVSKKRRRRPAQERSAAGDGGLAGVNKYLGTQHGRPRGAHSEDDAWISTWFDDAAADAKPEAEDGGAQEATRCSISVEDVELGCGCSLIPTPRESQTPVGRARNTSSNPSPSLPEVSTMEKDGRPGEFVPVHQS